MGILFPLSLIDPCTLLDETPGNHSLAEPESYLLRVNLIITEQQEGDVILLQIDNCEVYRLPELH